MEPQEADKTENRAQEAAESEEADNSEHSQVDPLAYAVARYREMVTAMPGIVPEMVGGSTIEEVDASAEVARQAYQAISHRIAAEYEAQVPPGNPPRSGNDPGAGLRPEAKIALGLRGK